MRRTSRQRFKITQGRLALALAFTIVALSSGRLGFVAVHHLDQTALNDRLSIYQWWIVISSALGGVIALSFSGDRLGQPGLRGILRATLGGFWVTFTGALIGGTLGLPLYGTMFGPFIVCVTLLGTPVTLMIWVVTLYSTHQLLGLYRREQDGSCTARRQGHADPSDGLPAWLRTRLRAF